MKKTILFFVMLCLLSVLVVAAYEMTQNAPSEYAVQTSTDVMFNWTPTSTDLDDFNCSVFWRTNRTGSYLNETPAQNMTNNTAANITVSFNDGDRVWWKTSCYNRTDGANEVNSTVRIFDIDVNYYTLSLGVNKLINFTLDTGASVVATLDTGQGANELYEMNQSVLNISNVTFATVDTGQGANELYDMDQDVLTTNNVTFSIVRTSPNISSTTCNDANAGDIYYNNITFLHYGCNSSHWNALY